MTAAQDLLNQFCEPPTKLDLVLALVQKTATSDASTSVHAMSVRVPTIEFLTIEALAEHSGLSRNKIVCQLLGLALEQVCSGLDEENAKAVQDIRSRLITDALSKGGFLQAEKGEV